MVVLPVLETQSAEEGIIEAIDENDLQVCAVFVNRNFEGRVSSCSCKLFSFTAVSSGTRLSARKSSVGR